MFPSFAGRDVINRRCRHSVTASNLNYRNMKGTKGANFNNVVVVKFRKAIGLAAMISDWNMKHMIRMMHILFRCDSFQVRATVVGFLSISMIRFRARWKATQKSIYHQPMNQVLPHLSIFTKGYKYIPSRQKIWFQEAWDGARSSFPHFYAPHSALVTNFINPLVAENRFPSLSHVGIIQNFLT